MKGCNGKPVSSSGDRHYYGPPAKTNWKQQRAEWDDLLRRFREREEARAPKNRETEQ